jgi:chitin binding protein
MTPAPRHPARVVGFPAVSIALLLAPAAAAHIDMLQPPPREVGSSREPNSDLKQGPCGQVTTGRTSRVSVFEPGETIEVTWTETINHRSYYRVAFDRDGDDAFPTFPGPGRGAQGIDPRGPCPVDGQVILAYELEDGARGNHTLQVTLPDVECERCTLQVVQYMFDATNPYYFQCADVALRRRDPADAGSASEALDASLSDAAAGSEPRAAPGCFDRIAPLDAGRGSARPEADDDTPAPAASPRPAPSSTRPEDADDAESMAGAAGAVAARHSSGCAIVDSASDAGSCCAWLLLAAAAVLRRRPSQSVTAASPSVRSPRR